MSTVTHNTATAKINRPARSSANRSRRSLFARAAGAAVAALAAPSRRAAARVVEPDEPATIDPEPMLFELQGVFWEVDPVDRSVRYVPRPEALADDPEPQPEPLAVEQDGGLILRVWRPGDVRHCRLCATCGADTIPATGSVAYRHPELVGTGKFCMRMS